MDYYHNTITDASWSELVHLKKMVAFVLIGGWAAYLYTKTLKSKDIDIAIEYDQLPLLNKYYPLSKNNRLKKYEAVKGPVQIDIYVPHYSEIGIPIEDVLHHTRTIEGFTVAEGLYLFLLKLFVFSKRGFSPKGTKDFIDLIALVQNDKTILQDIFPPVSDYHLANELLYFKKALSHYRELPELGLNRHQYARIKKTILNDLNE